MQKKIRLFCIPYAGGCAYSYNNWRLILNGQIELFPVELPGRGSRWQEPLGGSMEEIVEDIYNLMSEYLDEMAYAIFGHSMGSDIAHDLYYKIISENRSRPIHVFFSGMSPPHVKYEDIPMHQLSDESFKEELLKLGGTSEILFKSKRLAEKYLSIIRNDLRIFETKKYSPRNERLDCDITVMHGSKDTSVKGDMKEWQQYSNREFNIRCFNGGHFFIFEKQVEVITEINSILTAYLE